MSGWVWLNQSVVNLYFVEFQHSILSEMLNLCVTLLILHDDSRFPQPALSGLLGSSLWSGVFVITFFPSPDFKLLETLRVEVCILTITSETSSHRHGAVLSAMHDYVCVAGAHFNRTISSMIHFQTHCFV